MQAATAETRPALSRLLLKNHGVCLSTCCSSACVESTLFPIKSNDAQSLHDFVAKYARPYDPETDGYDRPPFAADIKEGKNDPIYNAHSYHTKVPPRGIIPYILHYTRPGDLILDPFCGSGMTGVAAQMCANPPADLLEQFPELKERVGPR